MKYFQTCSTLEEVKQLYRQLAKLHHPDKGGNLQTMQEINNEYVIAIATIARGGKFTAQEAETEILAAQAYKDALNKIIALNGITIELIGSWLWVTGKTFQHLQSLKDAGFIWAKKKVDRSAYFFRTDEYKSTNKGQHYTIDQIRNKYGSQTINSKSFYLS